MLVQQRAASVLNGKNLPNNKTAPLGAHSYISVIYSRQIQRVQRMPQCCSKVVTSREQATCAESGYSENEMNSSCCTHTANAAQHSTLHKHARADGSSSSSSRGGMGCAPRAAEWFRRWHRVLGRRPASCPGRGVCSAGANLLGATATGGVPVSNGHRVCRQGQRQRRQRQQERQ